MNLVLLTVTILSVMTSFFILFCYIKKVKRLTEYIKKCEGEINTDSLTRLWSRRKLMLDLDMHIKRGIPFVLAFIDIDGLKLINDCYGHAAGNKLLKSFAGRLKAKFANSYRIGGDEFVVIIEDYNDFKKISQDICDIEYSKDDQIYNKRIYFSIGLAAYPLNATTKEQLMEIADGEMYEDKKRKSNSLENEGYQI